MNKKFSTLLAALMVAGAWTTTDAKVVSITKPVVGGTYLIGTAVTPGEGDKGTVNYLLGTDLNTVSDAIPILDDTYVWTFKAVPNKEGEFYLEKDGYYVGVSGTGSSDYEIAIKDAVAEALTFTWDENAKKITVATLPTGATSSTTGIKVGLFLQLNDDKPKCTNPGTAVALGSYSEDAYEGLPGLENVTTGKDNTSGLIDITTLETDEEVKAPIYILNGNNKAFTVKYDATAKKYILDEPLATVSASKSLSASWRWNNGKLYSVAAEREREKTVVLKATDNAGNLEYSLVEDAAQGTEFTPTAEGLKVGDKVAIPRATPSATSLAAAATITVAEKGVIVDGKDLKLCTGIPSDYCIITLSNGAKTYYLHAKADGTVEAVDSETANFFDAEDDGFWWKVTRKASGDNAFNYTFTSRAVAGNKAIVWQGNGTTTFVAATSELNGLTLASKDMSVQADGTLDKKDGIKAIVGFYEAPTAAKTQAQLNTLLNPGFEMTVKISENGKEVIEGIDVFGVKMYPISEGATPDEIKNAKTVKLWNNEDPSAKDAKILVLDKTITNKDNANVNGAFKWITETELNKNEANYLTDFQFRFSSGRSYNTAMIDQLVVMNKDGLTVYGAAYILPVQNNTTHYLTALTAISDDSKLPYIKLGSDNIYPVKNLLGKLWNITYADTRANAKDDNEEYKLNGIVAVTYKNGEDVADYVASNTVVESAPEAQWLVTSADLNENTFTLTNRENQDVKIENIQLRLRDGDKFEVYIMTSSTLSASQNNLKGTNNDIIYLTESAKKDNFQGYMQTTENTLRSNNYHLGQYHAIGGNHNAYFVENHANSHQIGAVADKDEADKWKLHFALKADDDDKYTEVDTVYVIAEYATLNSDKDGFLAEGDKNVKKDTLAILPYTFQKVANREFVAFNPQNKTNLDFYACDGENKDNSVSSYTKAARFALKVKPNGYNFIEIVENDEEEEYELSSNKAYLANSAENGSLERMQTYAPDNNSVMVVEPADASEYHKIAQVWGDTIKLFREENNAQVLYEKADAKSVVEKETLSFLNIDNVNQFNVNPAIFADTAYINRWDADGVLNTTYQYLLAVNPSFGYHVENCSNPSHKPEVSNQIDTVYGRFLVNLIDTANVYGVNHIHTNWYTNDNEAGEKRAKLSFVEGYHTNDTLYLTRQGGEIVKIGMDSPDFNVAKFAFRYVDSNAKTFKIQTQFKEYLGDPNIYDNAEEFADAYDADPSLVSNEGYLKWINGTVVVEKGYENGDVFGIEENYAGTPTANENAPEVSSVSVIATDGAVIIKGAAGKNVAISNILGQTIANTVVTSDEATIAAPAGVVVVAVEGEAAVKAIVK